MMLTTNNGSADDDVIATLMIWGFGKVIIARLAAIIGAIIIAISAMTLVFPEQRLSMEFWFFWCVCLNILQKSTRKPANGIPEDHASKVERPSTTSQHVPERLRKRELLCAVVVIG